LHLSEAGQLDAKGAAERLAQLTRLDAVYSSPLERARETAAPTARARALKVKIHRGLLECDFGTWTGEELRKLSKLPEWSTVQRFPSGFCFPEGESFATMQARMVTTVNELADRHQGGVIALFSHADPIKAYLANALGTHLDLFQRIVISTGAISAVSIAKHGVAVLMVNSANGSLAELKVS
jgi:broad specificity phosphatase PhoE